MIFNTKILPLTLDRIKKSSVDEFLFGLNDIQLWSCPFKDQNKQKTKNIITFLETV